jgi:hypothetical protein
MWDPGPLTTLWAFTACYRDSLADAEVRIYVWYSIGQQDVETEGDIGKDEIVM